MLPEVFLAKAGLPNAANGVMPGAHQQNGHHPVLDEDLDRESRLRKVYSPQNLAYSSISAPRTEYGT